MKQLVQDTHIVVGIKVRSRRQSFFIITHVFDRFSPFYIHPHLLQFLSCTKLRCRLSSVNIQKGSRVGCDPKSLTLVWSLIIYTTSIQCYCYKYFTTKEVSWLNKISRRTFTKYDPKFDFSKFYKNGDCKGTFGFYFHCNSIPFISHVYVYVTGRNVDWDYSYPCTSFKTNICKDKST